MHMLIYMYYMQVKILVLNQVINRVVNMKKLLLFIIIVIILTCNFLYPLWNRS